MRILFILLSLLFISPNSFATEKNFVVGNWKFIYGDDNSYSDVKTDDSNWSSVKLDEHLPVNDDYDLVGWYRVRFDAHVDISEQYSLIINDLRLADETWINGVKVGGLGSFSSNWQFNQNSPYGLVRKYDLPAGFLNYKDNLLAIKVVTGFGKAKGAVLPVGVGLGSNGIFLSELKQATDFYNSQIVKTSSLDVVFLTMGLIELLVLLLLVKNSLSRSSEFKWIFFASVCIFIGAIGHDFFYIFDLGFSYGVLYSETFTNGLLFSFTLLFTPLPIFLYFWSQVAHAFSLRILAISLVYFSLCVLIIFPGIYDNIKVVCWYVWSLFTFSFIISYFYSAIQAVSQSRVGSIAQLIGLIGLIVFALLHHFGDGFFGHRNIQFGSLFYRYLLLFAYIQKIRTIRLNYKKLSARMVNVIEKINAKIARELHDGLGQHLASMKIHSQLLGKKLNIEKRSSLAIIQSELDNSTTSLRQLINGLHPAIVDKYTIHESVTKESSRFESIFPVNIEMSGSQLDEIFLNNNTKLNIFRIFQECVTNAIKHGKAQNIDIFLSIDEHIILLNINDDGCGYKVSKESKLTDDGGLGFISLRERVAILNGHIEFESTTNQGSNVSVVLPIKNKV